MKKFNITNNGKYDKKEVSQMLFDLHYEKIIEYELKNLNSIKQVPNSPKKFAKYLEKIINDSKKYHCGIDISGYSNLVYGIWGIIAKRNKSK